MRVALNQVMSAETAALTEGRSGLFPTGHRGLSMASTTTARVAIQTHDFNVADEIEALRRANRQVGAVCNFIGTVRDRNEGSDVRTMELEHYPGMTEKSIEAMIDEAFKRFNIFGARVIHRVGLLQPLDQIVLVVVTSAHRGKLFRPANS